MARQKKYPFAVPRGFVGMRLKSNRSTRYAITVRLDGSMMFFNLESGQIVTLQDIRSSIPLLPKEEGETLTAFFKAYPLPMDLIFYWAVRKKDEPYRGGKDYAGNLARDLLKEKEELV